MTVHCPFCKKISERTIHAGTYWWVTHNKYPYTGLQHHLLVIPHRHVENISEITPEESAEIFAIIQHTIEHFKIEGGGVLMRFGDPKFNNSSVPHAHLHIMVPDGTVPVRNIFYQEREHGIKAPNYR
jgi:diadenosine tetraphosphate (Ap4A) HIT family hydrolase